MNQKWQRVTRSNHCPICQKPDWCCIGEVFVNCMRIASDKPCKNGGWLHPINGTVPKSFAPRVIEEKPSVNWDWLICKWRRETTPESLQRFANTLGVTFDSLRALDCCWAPEYQAWAFPMRNASNNITGIRLRSQTRKWAVTGSREGIFIPQRPIERELWITEGPTDCAALVSLGKFAIGRPSCQGGVGTLLSYVRQHRFRSVHILADNDAPGIAGAQRLATALKCARQIVVLPTKDAREFVQVGGTVNMLDNLATSGIVIRTPPQRETRNWNE